MDSINTIQKAIWHTAGSGKREVIILAVVSAFVGWKKVISEETINVSLSIHHDHAEVGIFWEKNGYENYKDIGLYGLMNSNYQSFIDTGNNTFKIAGDTYEIFVNYNGAKPSSNI